jgi:hypothetical protein
MMANERRLCISLERSTGTENGSTALRQINEGSILMPAENVAIQQGETKGPYYSRAFTDACFIVTTTGPSTISITTTPSTESSIRFIDPSYQYLNSEFVVDPSVSLPTAVSSLSIQISSTNRYDFTITVN